jgi:hypothetical protein
MCVLSAISSSVCLYQGVDVDNPVPVAKVTEAVLLAANKLAVNAY